MAGVTVVVDANTFLRTDSQPLETSSLVGIAGRAGNSGSSGSLDQSGEVLKEGKER